LDLAKPSGLEDDICKRMLCTEVMYFKRMHMTVFINRSVWAFLVVPFSIERAKQIGNYPGNDAPTTNLGYKLCKVQ